MKILFLCRRPFDTIVGGVSEYLHYLPIELKSLGIECISYTEGDGKHSKIIGPRLLSNGMEAYEGPYLKPGLFSFTRKLKPLFDFCRKEKIDLIHAQGVYRSGYVALQIYKQTGIPYILTSHSDILSINSQRIQRNKVQSRCQKILKNAKALTHLTPFMQQALHQIQNTQEKDFIIGNGIALSEWQSAFGLPEQNYMLAIGRLETGKGFNILIDAYTEFQKQGATISLVIAGDGADKHLLQEQVKKNGLNLITDLKDFTKIPEKSVIFTGYVKGDLKKQLFAQSKFILFATQPEQWFEAFGIVLLESMAAGKALLASDIESTRYLQSSGLQTILVKPDDINAWTLGMKKLSENRALREKLGQTNFTNAQHFDWRIIAKQHEETYRKILDMQPKF